MAIIAWLIFILIPVPGTIYMIETGDRMLTGFLVIMWVFAGIYLVGSSLEKDAMRH